MLRLSEPFFFQVVVKKVKNLCSREGDLDRIEKQKKKFKILEELQKEHSQEGESLNIGYFDKNVYIDFEY